jgi:hypothetical protein
VVAARLRLARLLRDARAGLDADHDGRPHTPPPVAVSASGGRRHGYYMSPEAVRA